MHNQKVAFGTEREGVPTPVSKGRQLMNKTSSYKCRKVSCTMLKLLPGNISSHNRPCESDNSWRHWTGKHNCCQATCEGQGMLAILCTTSGIHLLCNSFSFESHHLFLSLHGNSQPLCLNPSSSFRKLGTDADQEHILHGLGLGECWLSHLRCGMCSFCKGIWNRKS